MKLTAQAIALLAGLTLQLLADTGVPVLAEAPSTLTITVEPAAVPAAKESDDGRGLDCDHHTRDPGFYVGRQPRCP
jgi:hypothetical protein